MCSGFCLRYMFALFPAYVSCLGSYEGNMPTTNVQRVLAHTFPETGPKVKQVGSVIDLPRTQDTQRRYQKEGSSVKSDSKDCQISDNQDENKPFKSVPIYNLLGFGQASSQHKSSEASDVFKKVQSVSQLDYIASQGGSTLMETHKVLGSKTFKPSAGLSSYEARKSARSSKIFAVQAPENVYDQVWFKPQVSKEALVGDLNQAQFKSISKQFSKHGTSQRSPSFGTFKEAGSTHGPVLTGVPMNSRTISRKPPYLELTQEAKAPVVSSGPIFILQGSESSQGLGGTLPDFVKQLGIPRNVDFNQFVAPQSSQTSIVPMNVGGPNRNGVQSWNEPDSSLMGGQSGAGPKPLKLSGSDCKDDVSIYSVASSGEIRLKAVESVKSGHNFESREEVQHPRRFQKTYDTRGPFQSMYTLHSVSGSKLDEVKPMHPFQNGAQRNVVKSTIASSGEIRMMSVPANVKSKTQTSPSSQNALQYQPIEARQYSRDITTTGTYASPPQSGNKVASFMGTLHKPGSVAMNSFKPSTADSYKINTVHVRPNKWPKSSFGNLQNQWASGHDVGASIVNGGAPQTFLPSRNLGQRQNVQTPVRSSVPLYHGSKNIRSQSAVIQENEMTNIPHEFGKGIIRRLSTISSSFRPAQGVESSVPECEVTQNPPLSVGQQGPVKYTSSMGKTQRQL